jgi:hypothetical protein
MARFVTVEAFSYESFFDEVDGSSFWCLCFRDWIRHDWLNEDHWVWAVWVGVVVLAAFSPLAFRVVRATVSGPVSGVDKGGHVCVGIRDLRHGNIYHFAEFVPSD